MKEEIFLNLHSRRARQEAEHRDYDRYLPEQRAFLKAINEDRKNSTRFNWGFCVVMCLAVALASFLMFSAWGRFSGPAWAGAGRQRGVIEVVDEGFITVEVTDTKREALIAQAANLNNNNLSEQADAKKIIDVEVEKLDVPEIKKDVKPEEIKKAAPEIKKDIKSEEIKKAAPEVKEEIKPEVKNSFPNLYAYVPEISDQEALRDVEDFGAMPKSLSGAEYESIVLNIHEDGTKVPELAPEELAELEGIEQSPEPEVKNLKAENNNKEVKDIKDVKDAKDLKAEAKKPEVKAVKEDIKLEETGAAWHEHIVKSGETLSDIALAYGGVIFCGQMA